MERRHGSLVHACSMLARSSALVMAVVLAGCGGGSAGPPVDAGTADAGRKPCAPGELTLDGGACQPAGLPPDMPCPPGELPVDGGTCQKAGVPPASCGVGFQPDGNDGCEPILPPSPCPTGQMAVPGDTACHDVAPCGSGTWGDIPVEADTQFVDQAYAGGNSDGTQAHPWTTIGDGVDAAASGAIVAVAAGTYAEDVLIQGLPVRIWGRCPAMVEIAGTGLEPGAVTVLQKPAGGAEVHGVAVTGAKAGISVSGASDVVIEGVWVHDTQDVGVDVGDAFGPTSVVLKGSLCEQNQVAGVYVLGSDVTVSTTAIRSTQVDSQGNFGRGIDVEDDEKKKARASVTVSACLVEQAHEHGVFVLGSDAKVEGTVIRTTQPGSQENFAGIAAVDDPVTNARASVTVSACFIDQNQDLGIAVSGSDATIEATVVRSTQPDAQGKFGAGIAIQDDPATSARANVTISACLVEQNQDDGVFVLGSDATIEATVVRSTQSSTAGSPGRGVTVEDDAKERAKVTVRASLVAQNHDVGIFVAGSDATIEATLVQSNMADGLAIQDDTTTKARADVTVRASLVEQNQRLGVFVAGSDATIETTRIHSNTEYGVAIQDDPTTKARADVTVRACLVEQNHEVGILVAGSDATIEASVARSTQGGPGMNIEADLSTKSRSTGTVRDCLVEQNELMGVGVLFSDAAITTSTVRDTAARGGDYGDGIIVSQGNATIDDAEVTGNARAGVSNFGGKVVITGGVFTCNEFDVDGEIQAMIEASFDGSAGWQCSQRPPAACTALGYCKIAREGLDPPPAPPPAQPPAP